MRWPGQPNELRVSKTAYTHFVVFSASRKPCVHVFVDRRRRKCWIWRSNRFHWKFHHSVARPFCMECWRALNFYYVVRLCLFNMCAKFCENWCWVLVVTCAKAVRGHVENSVFCGSYAHCSYWPEMSCTMIFYGSIVLDFISTNFPIRLWKLAFSGFRSFWQYVMYVKIEAKQKKMHQFRNVRVKILQFCFHDFLLAVHYLRDNNKWYVQCKNSA